MGLGRSLFLYLLLWMTAVAWSGAEAREGIARHVLPNGLTLIVQEDHTRDLAGVSLCVNGGSRTETVELSGLSHYYEHLIFRGGSALQEPTRFRRRIQQLGEESGGYTSDDFTNYGFTVARDDFPEAFRLATDAWLDLIPSAEMIAIEKPVVLEEYNQSDDSPGDQVYYQLLRLVYQVSPYRVSPLGLRSSIEAADLQTFRTFYQERYVPNQMVLSLCGDLDADSVLALVRRTWGARPPGRSSFELGLVEPEQESFRFAERAMKTATTRVLLGLPVPAAASAESPVVDLLAAMLGNGKSSRLWKALKIESDAVLSAYAWHDPRLAGGMLVVGFECGNTRVPEALDRLARELTRLATEPPSVDEMSRFREILLAGHARSGETVFDRAEALGRAEIMGTAYDLDRYPGLLRSVTRTDLAAAARRFLTPARASLSIVRPDTAAALDPANWQARWEQSWSTALTSLEPRNELGRGTVGREPAGSPAAGPAGAGSTASGDAKLGGAPEEKSGHAEERSAEPVRWELANGTVLVVQSLPQAPMVGASVMIRGGQWAEPRDLPGLAAFTARLLDRGAAGKSQAELADQLAALGSTLHSRAMPDYIEVQLDSPAAHHRAALELLADVIAGPTFPKTEAEKVRAEMLADLRSMPDRPFENTNRYFREKLYAVSPYRRPVLGTESAVAAFSGEAARAFTMNNFLGTNTVVVVAGPVDPAVVRGWCERRFGVLSRGEPIRLGGLERPRQASVDTLVAREQEQVTFNTGWTAVPFTHADYVPLRCAVAVLSDRFFYKYVYEKSVAYRSWFLYNRALGPGSIHNEMGVSPEVYPEISREVLRDVESFLESPIPEAEYKAAIAKTLARESLRTQTSAALASDLAFWELSGKGVRGWAGLRDEIRGVKREQALAVARRYLNPEAFVRVAVGPSDRVPKKSG